MRLYFILFFMLVAAAARPQTPVWSEFPNSPAGSFRNDDIFFTDQQHGWSARGTDGVYRSTNGGQTWIKAITNGVTIPLTAHFRSIGFASATHGWAGNLGPGSYDATVTDTNLLYETFDGGLSWGVVTQLNYTGMQGFCAIHVYDSQHIYGAGRVRGPAYFVKSTDGGANWSVTNLTAGGVMGGLMDVYFKDPTNGFVVGMNTNSFFAPPYFGSIARTTNGGLSWQVLVTTSVTNCYFWKMSWPSPQIGYASLQQNNAYTTAIFYKTTDGGATWVSNGIPLTSIGSPPSFELQGVGFVSTNEGWLGGSPSVSQPFNFIHTTDGGLTWAPAGYNDTSAINRFRFVNTTLAYMSGIALHVYHVPLAATIAPSGTNTSAGSNVMFTATAYGTVPMQFQWRLNRTNLPGAITNSYSITNAQAGNVGNYTLVLSDFSGSITSAPSALTISGLPIAPGITVQPQSQIVNKGSNATFTVTATGTAPLTCQWYFDNTNLTGAIGFSYTVTNTQATNCGNYFVVVTNIAGSVTSAVAVLALSFLDDFDSYTTPVVVTNPATTNGYKIFFGAASGGADFKAIFGFDYSAVQSPVNIPPAPHSSGTTKGLYLTANKFDANAAAAAVNLYPVGQIFTNNFSLKFDLWINWTNLATSTEHALFGVNHSGNVTNRIAQATSDGIFFAMDGDGGVASTSTSIRDYSVFHGAGSGATPVLVTSSSSFGPTPPLGANFDNADAGFVSLFPSITIPYFGTTPPGSAGLRWLSVEVRQENNLVTWLLDNVAVVQFTNNFGYTGGAILIGYNDTFSSIGDPNNFAIFDNVRVDGIVYPPVKIVSPQLAGTNFDFSFGTDAYESYTVQWTTNLAAGTWATYTNFYGSGSTNMLTIPIPAGSSAEYFRVVRP